MTIINYNFAVVIKSAKPKTNNNGLTVNFFY